MFSKVNSFRSNWFQLWRTTPEFVRLCVHFDKEVFWFWCALNLYLVWRLWWTGSLLERRMTKYLHISRVWWHTVTWYNLSPTVFAYFMHSDSDSLCTSSGSDKHPKWLVAKPAQVKSVMLMEKLEMCSHLQKIWRIDHVDQTANAFVYALINEACVDVSSCLWL